MKIKTTHLRLAVMAVLVLATWAVYGQTLQFDFVNIDDSLYVTNNPRVLDGLGSGDVAWAFRTFTASNWHPLTWLSLMLDAGTGGVSPRAFHRTNVLLHLCNTLLLFHVLTALTGATWRSGFVAVLFALHPLHAESVAWVAERKDVLSTMFWLLTMGAHARYAKRPSRSSYALVLVFFALGLMSKPMLVTLPFVLLLLDYWPLGRMEMRRGAPWLADWRPVTEKIPMFAMATASCTVTLWAQWTEVSGGAERFSFPLRAANATVSYAWYLLKAAWPSGLASPYAYTRHVAPLALAASALLLLVVTGFVLRRARRRGYLLTGWLWYLGTLVPVIGLVQVGLQPRADRYTYVPLIGIFIIAAWGIPELARLEGPGAGTRRKFVAVAATASLVLLGWASWIQAGYWRDSMTLFSRALAVSGENVLAHHGMGLALFQRGETDGALHHYREAIRVDPASLFARVNLAGILSRTGRSEEAVEHYREALRLSPTDVGARVGLGATLNDLGRFEEAEALFEESLRIDPGSSRAEQGMGFALARQGRIAEATEHLSRAVEIDPREPSARMNLAILLLQQGRVEQAEAELLEVLRLDPGRAAAHRKLGLLHARRGEIDAAIERLEEALRLDPGREDVRRELQQVRALSRGP